METLLKYRFRDLRTEEVITIEATNRFDAMDLAKEKLNANVDEILEMGLDIDYIITRSSY